MNPSRMQQMSALGADWWNDSCDLRELGEAVARGAVGATSNPVIVATAVSEDRARWIPELDALIKAHPDDTEDDIAWRLIAEIGRQAAALLRPVFERTGGEKGFLSMQVNPKFHPSRDRMVEQGSVLAWLAPNIAIKAPAVGPGIAAMEELTARGIRVNATVSFTVAQAIACAEAIERGLDRGRGSATQRPYVTLMVGRLDDHLKRVEQQAKTGIDPACLDWAGIAVFRKTARLFRERGYRSSLLAAAYRHEGHWAEIIGPRVLQSMPYKWWKQFDGSAREPRVNVEDPIDPKIIDALSAHFADFRAAYDERGLAVEQFRTFGPTVATLNQFLGGYEQLLAIVRSRMLA